MEWECATVLVVYYSDFLKYVVYKIYFNSKWNFQQSSWKENACFFSVKSGRMIIWLNKYC